MINRPTPLRAVFVIITLVAVLVPMGGSSAGAVTADPPQIGFASGGSSVSQGNEFDIFVANADGSGIINLTAGFGSTYQWAWSPDGSQIAFVSYQDGARQLFVRELSSPAPFQVAEVPVSDRGFRWSPDGTNIVFVSGQDESSEIYVADVSARSARNVSQDALRSFDPRWSPTGSHLAYTVRGEVGEDVYIVARSGGTPVNVTNDTGWSSGGAWSPDGARFAFVSNRDGNDEIYLADSAGRNPVRLTNNLANDRDPTWSPDGSQIAYSSGLETRSDGGVWEIVIPSRIYVVNVDGSNRRQLTDGSIDSVNDWTNSLAQTPTEWAPNGGRLAVVASSTGPGPHNYFFTFYTIDAQAREDPIPLWSGGGSWSSSRSPDGARLALSSSGNYGFDSTTVIVAADGTGTPLTLTGGVGSGFAGWSTYGTHLAYMNSGSIQPGDTVFVASPDGTAPIDISATLAGPFNTAASWRPQPIGPVGLVDTSTGQWHLGDAWGLVRSFYYGNPGDLPLMGDWDCDGVATPGLFREQDAFVYLRNANTQGVADIRFYFGNPRDVPLAGDFNGDGCDTVSIYRPAGQRFYIINALGQDEGGLGAADYSFVFGDPGDNPIVGDWDGDGIDEIGLFRPSTGFFYYRSTLDTGVADAKFYFGDPGDRFLAGDWGVVDGVDTPAVFRPSTNTFYFRHTNTPGFAESQQVWPADGSSWVAVPGIEQ